MRSHAMVDLKLQELEVYLVQCLGQLLLEFKTQ